MDLVDDPPSPSTPSDSWLARIQREHSGWLTAAIVVLAGLVAMLSGAEPTGSRLPDALICFSFGAVVAWAATTGPWWALLAASAATALLTAPDAIVLVIAAWGCIGASAWLTRRPPFATHIRTGVAAVLVNVLLRIEWHPFFLASALATATITTWLIIVGLSGRSKRTRKWVLRAAIAVGALAALSTGGLVYAAMQARSPGNDGYSRLLNGLELVERGDVPEAADVLRAAAADLRAASEQLDKPWSQAARFVPIAAQNRRGLDALLIRGAQAADAAAKTLDNVDLEALTIVNGKVDLDALARLAEPLAALNATVVDLQTAIIDIRSPWLAAPIQRRLDDAAVKADKVVVQSAASAATARYGPAMLGADGTRRYLFAFTNPAESRGLSGLMGNWTEITITNGLIEVSQNGRTNDLITGLRASSREPLDMPAEFLDRYGPYGAVEADGGPRDKFWSNVTMSPDMPTVGTAMAELYLRSTGRTLDGIFIVDPAGIASLLSVTGPIELPGLDTTLSADNAKDFLTLGQYDLAENDRETLLAAATEETIKAVLSTTLPPPQKLAGLLGAAAVEGHISGWASRPEEEDVFRLVGMEAALPVLRSPTGTELGTDGLAVVTNNGSGNKIDSFLQRDISYIAKYDPSTGIVDAELHVVLTNNAPATGYDDYVTGNLYGLPQGSSNSMLSIYTPLVAVGRTFEVAGSTASPTPVYGYNTELGYNVYTAFIVLPPGESRTVTLRLTGRIDVGGYALAYRPQPLPIDDHLRIEITSGGDRVVNFDGTLKRRSLITGTHITAWR